jgi:hypothetical protein
MDGMDRGGGRQWRDLQRVVEAIEIKGSNLVDWDLDAGLKHGHTTNFA